MMKCSNNLCFDCAFVVAFAFVVLIRDMDGERGWT